MARALLMIGVWLGALGAVWALLRAGGAPLVVWIIAPVLGAALGLIAAVFVGIVFASAMALAA